MEKHFLAVSVLIHVLLALLLFYISEKEQPKQKRITTKTIKSYLYKTPPKPAAIIHKIVKEKPLTVEKSPAKINAKPVISKDVTVGTEFTTSTPSSKSTLTAKPKSKPKQLVTQQLEQDSSDVRQEKHDLFSDNKEQKIIKKTITAGFSSYKQLENLRKSIKEKVMAEGVATHQQFRSPSIMHGAQIPVPHSSQQLTWEQAHEQNTLKMSGDISITKNDNGTCIIEREQFLGSPVEGSTSVFSCGESKFDKSFREHMRKVQNKIMPKK